ncbi:5-hydroxytryptamine receptor 1B [Holothuria leucospilota]|uniref:5-hydroxytryptamine receptor 1B n=1 Tax=Holothuria leucospilota TaxID=206669 RepID=A0A9Q1CLX5_HOLLE|nr:5-hydroxytryptamine receptor 1B [Holothuria leucospilota]
MSFDRYQLVSDALKYNRRTTRKRLCYTIIPVWIIGLISSVAVYITFGYFSNLLITEPCSKRTNILYGAYLFGLFIYDYLIPLGILVFLNVAIYIKLVIRSKQFTHKKRCGEENAKYNISSDSSTEERVQNEDCVPLPAPDTKSAEILVVAIDENAETFGKSKEKTKVQNKANFEGEGQGAVNVKSLRKAGRQLFTLVSVFVVCWLPVHLLLLMSATKSWSWDGKELWYYFAHIFLAANSAINPIVYLRVCRRYRDQVFHMVSQVKRYVKIVRCY